MNGIRTFVSENKRKLLSIDGGGMKGIIALSMLKYLEDQSGKATHEIFDMVSGTSTGAIIATGLAMGMSATEILDIYMKDLAPLFKKSIFSKGYTLVRSGFNHMYNIQPFVDIFKPYVEDATIGDVTDMDILITTKDTRTGNTYFMTNIGAGANTFKHVKLSDAVQASVSAPIFFPPKQGNFIDGGIGAYSNSSFALANEAMVYIGEEYGYVDGKVILVSLGNGYQSNTLDDGMARKMNPFSWLRYILREYDDDAQLQQTYATSIAYKDRIDVRRYNVNLDIETLLHINLPYNHVVMNLNKVKIDTSNHDTLLFMRDVGVNYASYINWNKKDCQSWDTIGGVPKPKIINDFK